MSKAQPNPSATPFNRSPEQEDAIAQVVSLSLGLQNLASQITDNNTSATAAFVHLKSMHQLHADMQVASAALGGNAPAEVLKAFAEGVAAVQEAVNAYEDKVNTLSRLAGKGPSKTSVESTKKTWKDKVKSGASTTAIYAGNTLSIMATAAGVVFVSVLSARAAVKTADKFLPRNAPTVSLELVQDVPQAIAG